MKDSASIYLVKRGKCSFVEKTRNIQHAGGSMALVVDTFKNRDISELQMFDDNTGSGIRIPALLIKK